MAELKVSSMFSDNMVLQRDKPIIIWGVGEPGAEIILQLAEQRKNIIINQTGKWSITFDPLPAGGPHQLVIKSGTQKIELQNVMVGEVWLCSGQSNMQWKTADVANAEEEIRQASNYSDVRLYLVPKSGADQPREIINAYWQVCSPETVGEFSAVAYFFARELKSSPLLKNVPIGLIDASYGGTMVEAWISSDTLRSRFPDEELRVSLFGWKPSSMFNGMIAPVVPYQIRGVLWYQGESNCGRPEQYGRLFPAMIENWREAWKQPDLPFLFVQLPNYAEKIDGLHFTWLREVQQKVAQRVPHTAMAVTIDTDMGYDLHPKNKRDVALRLALLARNKVYGENIPCSGPVYKSHTIVDDTVRVLFDNTEGGLINKNCGPLRGFAIAGEDGVFWYADASIHGDEVWLRHSRVPAPRYVRYAWEGNPQADLYNVADLPAAPFRTDNFPPQDLELYLVPPSRTFNTSFYEILIDGNSWVLGLKVKGEEFLEPMAMSGVPGCFFPSFWGPLRLIHIKPLGPNLLFAEMETATMFFEFFEDRMQWTLTNKTDEELSFCTIFNKEIKAVKTEEDKIYRLPISGKYKQTTWYGKNNALRIDGEGTLRYPYDNRVENQTLEMRLKPKETRRIKITVGAITSDDRAKISNLLR